MRLGNAAWQHLRIGPCAPPRAVSVTAHRGGAARAPENTLCALERAVRDGADTAEVDVRATRDGIPVLCHDPTLDRTAGVAARLAELQTSDLAAIDVGSRFSPAHTGCRIPTLAAALAAARRRIRLNLDIKGGNEGAGVLALRVARLVRRQEASSECLITSSRPEVLWLLHKCHPCLRLGWVGERRIGPALAWPFPVLSLRHDLATPDVVRAAHRRGKEVHVWTVNEPEGMRDCIRRGVDGIITDLPHVLVRIAAPRLRAYRLHRLPDAN